MKKRIKLFILGICILSSLLYWITLRQNSKANVDNTTKEQKIAVVRKNAHGVQKGYIVGEQKNDSKEMLTDEDFYKKSLYPDEQSFIGVSCKVLSMDLDEQELTVSIQNDLDEAFYYEPAIFIQEEISEAICFKSFVLVSKQIKGEWKELIFRNIVPDIGYEEQPPEIGKENRKIEAHTSVEETFCLYPNYPCLTPGKYRVIIAKEPFIATEFDIK